MRDSTNMKLDRLIRLIEQGSTTAAACEATGLAESTIYRNAAIDSEFRKRLEKARDQRDFALEEAAVSAVVNAFSKSWQSAAFWLERRRPSKFALRHQFRDKETQPDTGAAAQAHERLMASPENRAAYVRHLQRRIEEIAAMDAEEAATANEG